MKKLWVVILLLLICSVSYGGRTTRPDSAPSYTNGPFDIGGSTNRITNPTTGEYIDLSSDGQITFDGDNETEISFDVDVSGNSATGPELFTTYTGDEVGVRNHLQITNTTTRFTIRDTTNNTETTFESIPSTGGLIISVDEDEVKTFSALQILIDNVEAAAYSANGNNFTGKQIFKTSQTPLVDTTCTTGQITWDTDYIYVCTTTSNWKRVVIQSW